MATSLISGLRLFRSVTQTVSSFSACATLTGGQKWRIRNGMANDGLTYGPLTDLPDWSFAGGQPAPETKRRKRRKYRRLQELERITKFLQEVDDGIKEGPA